MKRFYKQASAFLIAFALIFLMPNVASAAVLNVAFQQIAFSNVPAIGTNAAVGFTHRYVDAIVIGGQRVDAVFSVVAKSTGGSVNPVDAASNNTPSGATNQMINSTLNFSGNTDSITYQIDFVEGGTSTPITLQNVAISVGDIDIQQFAQFAGVSSYTLSNTPATRLTPQTNTGSIPAGAYRFQSTPTQSTAQNQENWVEVRYNELNSLQIVLGATVSGGAYFSIDFQPSAWANGSTTTTTPPATSYTVSYDGNSNTSGTAPAATSAAGSQSISTNTGSLVRPGFVFAGWNTLPDGTGVSYPPGTTIAPTGNLTLYALWTPQAAYSLTYSSNTASSGSVPASVTSSSPVTISSNSGNLSKPGHSFAGWNTSADGTGTTYLPGSTITLSGNITVYALWQPTLAATSALEVSQNLLAVGFTALISGALFIISSRINPYRTTK